MITIDLTKQNENPDQEDVEIIIPQFLDEEFMLVFRQNFTMELITGERNSLPDGSVQYKFTLDVDDADSLKEAILTVYTKFSGYNTSN